MVRRKNDHPTLVAMLREMLLQLIDGGRIQRIEGLIENPQWRGVKIQPCKCHPPLLACRERMARHVFEPAQPYLFQCW